MRVIWGRVAAIRKSRSLERLQQIFDEFIARGLLFTWEENGKRYGHWTGSDVPGRLPRRSWRARLEKLAPPVPCEALAAYSARFGGSKEVMVTGVSDASQLERLSDALPGKAVLESREHHGRFTCMSVRTLTHRIGIWVWIWIRKKKEKNRCVPLRQFL